MSRVGEMIYEDLVARGKKDGTAKEWRSMVERFVESAGDKDDYARSDLIRHLANLRKIGHSQNTINKEMRPLKLLCQIQGWASGFPKLAMPKVRQEDVKRTIFSKGEIEELITKGKRLLSEQDRCYLALATTYGLRREEIAMLQKEDMNGFLLVRTVKGGSSTKHVVPPEIQGLTKYFRPCRTDYMTMVFRRIMKKVGMKHEEGFGWHSIRRSLATELLMLDVSGINILRFMRWSEASIKGEFGMLTIYAKKDQERVDTEIFKVHPFLKHWRS